jgi:hypothetical protein
MHRPSTAPEKISFGMEVIAVAVGVGYGVVDTIARRTHRADARLRPGLPMIDLRDHAQPASPDRSRASV